MKTADIVHLLTLAMLAVPALAVERSPSSLPALTRRIRFADHQLFSEPAIQHPASPNDRRLYAQIANGRTMVYEDGDRGSEHNHAP